MQKDLYQGQGNSHDHFFEKQNLSIIQNLSFVFIFIDLIDKFL